MKVLNFNDPYVDRKGYVNNLGDVLSDISVDLTDYAKKTDIPATLPANGGNADTVNNHTVESNVPENAVFTDTIYDDTEVKESIVKLSSNLDTLEFGEISGVNNILDITQNYISNSNGVLSVSGNKVTVTGDWYCYYIIDVEENTDYFISGNVDSYTNFNYCAVYNEDVSTPIVIDCLNKTFNSGNNTKIAFLLYSGNGESGTTVFSNLMIEKGTKATDYKPYIPSVKMLADDLGGLSFSVSGTTLSITDGENTWTLNANS